MHEYQNLNSGNRLANGLNSEYNKNIFTLIKKICIYKIIYYLNIPSFSLVGKPTSKSFSSGSNCGDINPIN